MGDNDQPRKTRRSKRIDIWAPDLRALLDAEAEQSGLRVSDLAREYLTEGIQHSRLRQAKTLALLLRIRSGEEPSPLDALAAALGSIAHARAILAVLIDPSSDHPPS